ncbi:MAG: hypothetical protein M3315_01095 [Actinomycetota bacterium]|nr:hypothetical protein [Actinomycetota bacterium]
MADYEITKGDWGFEVVDVLEDRDGTPVSLADASQVKFQMRMVFGTTLKVDAVARKDSNQGTNPGKVYYKWAQGDTDTAGLYQAEWRVTFTDNSVRTFPDGGFSVEVLP